MYTVNIVRYGQIVESYTVKNIRITLSQLAYVSVTNVGNVYNVVMATKKDCDITSLSTGSVGFVTKGIA